MKKPSQRNLVLRYIKDFGSITPLEAMRDLGVYRLSAVVFNLRVEGFDITTDMVDVPNRYGGKSRVARYRHRKL